MSDTLKQTTARNPQRVIDISMTSNSLDWRLFLDTILNGAQMPTEDNKKIVKMDELIVNPKIDLLMENKLPQFKMVNKFDTPIADFLNGNGSSKASKILSATNKFAGLGTNVISALHGGITGSLDTGGTSQVWNPWMKDVKSWSHSSGVEFSYTFNFTMGSYGLWNAREEVVKPILSLFTPVMPRYVSAYTMRGPLPHAVNLIANILESSKDFVKENNILESLGTSIQTIMMDAYKNFTYTVKFGNAMTFYKCMIKDGEFSFSNKTDTNGYPIAGEVTLNFETMAPPALTVNDETIRAIKFGGA